VVNNRNRLVNNVWNKGATTGRYREKIFVNDDNSKTILIARPRNARSQASLRWSKIRR